MESTAGGVSVPCALGFAAIPFFFSPGFLVISSSQQVSSPANLPSGSCRISPSARIPNKHCHVWKSPCWAPPSSQQELWLEGDSSQSLPKQQKFPRELGSAFGYHKIPAIPTPLASRWIFPIFPPFLDFLGRSKLLWQHPGCAIPRGEPKFGNVFSHLNPSQGSSRLDLSLFHPWSGF